MDHVFEREQVIDRPPAEVFEFFSAAGNLQAITPRSLHFRFESPPPARLQAGSEIRYRLKINGVPVRWVSRIADWDPPHRFSDLQVHGPYAYWLHTHTFNALSDGRTQMRDHVAYRVPFGLLGEAARRLFVERQLRALFDYRERALGPALRAT